MLPAFSPSQTPGQRYDHIYDEEQNGLAYDTAEGSNGENEIEDEHHNVSRRQTAYTGQDGIARERIAYHEGDTQPGVMSDAFGRAMSDR